MSEMSPARAFEILGLTPDANEEALKKAFREKSRASHPDTHAGDEATQKLLNEAKDVAARIISGNTSLIALASERAILRFETAVASEKAARQARDTENSIKRTRTGRLHTLKYLALVVGGISAGLGWLGDNFLNELIEKLAPHDALSLRLGFKFAALFALAIAAWFQFRVNRIEANIAVLAEELDDPRTCASKLALALNYADLPIVERSDLSANDHPSGGTHDPLYLVSTIRSFLTGLTPAEEQRLILLKSIEHGLLIPITPAEIGPKTIFQYRVNFVPSVFWQPPVPKQPTQRTQAMDARVALTTGLLCFVIFGALVVYLAVVKHTWWALAPVLLCLSGLGMITEGISALIMLRRRRNS
jgi:DnaJ-like protein